MDVSLARCWALHRIAEEPRIGAPTPMGGSGLHAMAESVIVLTLAAVVFSVVAFADPEDRGIWRVLAAGSLILGLSTVLLLVYAQRPTCDALGGQWIERSDSCSNEWGGNGNSD